jgi:hypothetical protein
MVDKLFEGVKKIRRMGRNQDSIPALVKAVEKSKDSAIKAVLAAYDGEPKELITKIKKMRGPTTQDACGKIGVKKEESPKKEEEDNVSDEEDASAAEQDASAEKEEAKKSKKVKGKAKGISKKSDQVPIDLVVPKQVNCPDTDSKGHPVVLVVSRDGMFGCGAIKDPQT